MKHVWYVRFWFVSVNLKVTVVALVLKHVSIQSEKKNKDCTTISIVLHPTTSNFQFPSQVPPSP